MRIQQIPRRSLYKDFLFSPAQSKRPAINRRRGKIQIFQIGDEQSFRENLSAGIFICRKFKLYFCFERFSEMHISGKSRQIRKNENRRFFPAGIFYSRRFYFNIGRIKINFSAAAFFRRGLFEKAPVGSPVFFYDIGGKPLRPDIV